MNFSSYIEQSLIKFNSKDWLSPPLSLDHPIEQSLNVIITNFANTTFTDILKAKGNFTHSPLGTSFNQAPIKSI